MYVCHTYFKFGEYSPNPLIRKGRCDLTKKWVPSLSFNPNKYYFFMGEIINKIYLIY